MTTATAKRPKNDATNTARSRKEAMKFRLLHGLHCTGSQRDTGILQSLEQQLDEGMISQAEFDAQSKGLKPRKIYHPGELIESKTDLLRLNGIHPMVPKYARAEDDVAAMVPLPYQTPDIRQASAAVSDTLSDMSLDQLRKMAKAEDINILGLNTEEEIAERIRQAMSEMDA